MNQKLFFSLLFFVLCKLCYAQTLVIQAKPVGKDLWGYANIKGEFIIEPNFERCLEFTPEGHTVVLDRKSNDFVIINIKGQIIKPEVKIRLQEFFAMMTGFSEGLLPVEIKSKWGFMDEKGKVAISPIYDKVSSFHNGYACAKKGKTVVVIDKSGNERIVNDPSVRDFKKSSEGMIVVINKDEFEGFLDLASAKVVVATQYASVGYYSDGVAWANIRGKLGYLDKQGEWVIQPQYLSAKEFDPISGLARVKTEQGWTYIDKKGTPYNFDSENYDDFKEGLCRGKKAGKIGFYDKTGKWVIEPKLQGARDFRNGYAAAREGDKWGVIDQKGNWVIQPKFEAIKDMELVK